MLYSYSYAIARYMLSPVRLSIRPSVTLLSGGRFSELRTIYQGCRALPFALARLSCYMYFISPAYA